MLARETVAGGRAGGWLALVVALRCRRGRLAVVPTSDEISRLLDTLCVRLGFCLPPVEKQRLCENPPSGVLAFTDAVFIAEGMDPELADRHLYRQIRDLVRRSFEGE